MSAFDAGFLQAEDGDRHISLAVGAVSIMAGPMPSYPELLEKLGARITLVPRLRQAVRSHRFDLGPPEWVDDPALDLGHHIRHAALPPPGDDEALFTFIGEAMEIRLDRDRPLWQCWIIEGLTDDRWAILMKIHHCIADGIATMHMLTGLSDDATESTYATDIHGSQPKQPGALQQLLRPSLNPLDWVRGAWGVTNAVGGATAGALELVAGLLRAAAPSTLVGPISTMRRYSAAQVALRDVTAVCQAFDVTINDVALAAITDSYRSALLRRGVEPGSDSLRTLVPVSVRGEQAMDVPDNRVSVMLPYLPVDVPDRVEQLRTVHRRLSRAKSGGQREGANAVFSALKLVPFPLTAWAVRTFVQLPQRGIVTLATNVPGPRQHLDIMGHRVLRVLPIPPVALRLRTSVAILSYGDHLEFGINADFDAAPDIDALATGVERAVKCLAQVARSGRRDGPGLALLDSADTPD